MSEARLAAGIEASALIRRAESEGGFGMVIQRGDAERGAVLLTMLQRGAYRGMWERSLQAGGIYAWGATGPSESESDKAPQYVDRRRRADPDCWILELDVASVERFIAETISAG